MEHKIKWMDGNENIKKITMIKEREPLLSGMFSLLVRSVFSRAVLVLIRSTKRAGPAAEEGKASQPCA